ncbi:MAG: Y-family DNA polymerase [Flavobacteriaceae bacterium]
MLALIDCNNFYASCERVFNPILNKKPIVILSNNDGCVISRSNEAKVLGIPMGAPAFKYQSIFKKNNVYVFSSNFPLYGDISSRIMNILSSFTPNIEIYSIDEAFLKFQGFNNYDLEKYCKKIQKKVLKWTGIPVSIGVGSSKSLAKVANKICKKFPEQTNGVYIIDSNKKRLKALKWLEIESVWGIGFRNSKKLKEIKVKNAYDFTSLNDSWVRKKMTVVGLKLKKELEGESILDLEEIRAKKKAIATTRSFENTISKFKHIEERISTFAVCCAEKLRAQNSNCSSIYVFIKSNKFKKFEYQYRKGIIVTVPFSTNSNIVISKYAIIGLEKIFKSGIKYKKAGVIVMGISSDKNYQMTLFENEKTKHKKLMKTIDFIQKKEGQNKIKLANQDLKKRWKMKQEKLSFNYTTKLDEIITVK